MAKKAVSITDVARRAKVSITTVSRVINKVPTVSKKNIEKVEEAVAALKYKPNVSAQRLASGLNTSIGLVMPSYPGIFHSYYAIELIRGVGHACETLRMDMIFHITDGNKPISGSRFGGVIFADIIDNREQVQSCIDDGIPCMVINNFVMDMPVNYVASDNLEGGKMATEYLINLGHKRIATISGDLKTQSGFQRLKGFREIMEAKGLPIRDEYIIHGDYSRICARQAAEKLFDMAEPPTAIFAASDDMALEVMSVATERGIKVPSDVSVIGYDDNPQATYSNVGLTTVRQPIFQMGEHGVKTLCDVINHKIEPPVQEVLHPEIVMRDSCQRCL